MSNSLDSVTAATKLRRDMMDVQLQLDYKRGEYRDRMARIKEKEEQLKIKRQALQDKLVEFYKFIQDNELKRNRANKKASAEEKAKQERHQKIVELSEEAKMLERQKQDSREKYLKYVKYQKYLEEVLQHGDNEEYQDPKDIIGRWQTLDDNKKVLQLRKTQLEEELSKNRTALSMKKQRKKQDSIELQNELANLQGQLDNLQKAFKKQQDKLDQSMTNKGATTKTISQVRMACQNLYDRCIKANPIYKNRTSHEGNGEIDMLTQLQVIGDCLEDYQFIIKKHQERQREKQLQQQQLQQMEGKTEPKKQHNDSPKAATART